MKIPTKHPENVAQHEETDGDLSDLQALYAGAPASYMHMLCAAQKQFKEIANGCQTACEKGDVQAFGHCKHQAHSFLVLIKHKALLRQLTQVYNALVAGKKAHEIHRLQQLFTRLQKQLAQPK